MVLFRHRSIRRDLVMIIMTISLLSIMLTSLSISFIHYINLQDRLLKDLDIAASIVSERTGELLPFHDVQNIKVKIFATLGLLENNSSIKMACLYSKQNNLIAFYDVEDHAVNAQAAANKVDNAALAPALINQLQLYKEKCPDISDGFNIKENGRIALFQPIYFSKQNVIPDAHSGKENVGSLYLEADLAAASGFMTEQLIATLAVCVGALIVCYILTIQLQRSISRPIQLLSEATRNVTVYKDYSVRVKSDKERYSQEINQLMESFNGMLKDIGDRDSKLMRKNIELERAKEMAESANMSKSQFLANISHELRTPLNAIIGFSSIIINQLFGTIGNDKYTDYAKDIHESGVHLLDIINDILDLSKAEAGKLSLRLESFDVQEALRKCEHIVAERALEGGITIMTDIPAELPRMIADRVRFIQIILNILSNAIKFTESGGRVDVTVECEKAGNDVHYFTFKIRDNGIGMRKEDIDMAFQTFGQVDSGLDRKYEGTGLGLPLTKKLVELHNGSIRIDSQLHKGTTVTIRFISDTALLR